MPLSRERQRDLSRRYSNYIVHAATLAECAAAVAWWCENCSIAPEPYQFHYARYDSAWHGTPYVNTTATERAIAASIARCP